MIVFFGDYTILAPQTGQRCMCIGNTQYNTVQCEIRLEGARSRSLCCAVGLVSVLCAVVSCACAGLLRAALLRAARYTCLLVCVVSVDNDKCIVCSIKTYKPANRSYIYIL